MVLFPQADPVAWHRQHGIVCLAGPGIRKDEMVLGANLLDLAPTLLALFGIPAAEDMRGRVLSEAFDQPPPMDRIPSWESVEAMPACTPPP